MYIILFLLCVSNGAVYCTSKIGRDILHYFKDGTVRSFADKWELYRVPTENAIASGLKETFDKPGLNIQIEKDTEALKVSDGFLVYDNIVYVLFKDMYLSRLPRLENPRVVFSLPSNVLQVEATLSRMLVETKYQLFRNISDVVYSDKNSATDTSPFSLQEVQNSGQATIIAEQCNLAGFVLATLQGGSVNLGQDHFKLNNCKFSIEISTSALDSPPVIAPYFAQELGPNLEIILVKPIQSRLILKLKDAVLSSVNTSSTLGNLLPTVRTLQQNLFKKTSSYITDVIKRLNTMTSEENAASEEITPMEITWTDEYEGKQQTSSVSLTNMTISGLDTAYSAQTGGAYKSGSVKINDAIRYSSLQVRGYCLHKVEEVETSFMFSCEVQDFISYATLPFNEVDDSKGSKETLKYETGGWRSLDINGPNSELVNTYSLITGFLLNTMPEIMTRHLSNYFVNATGYNNDDPHPEIKKLNRANKCAKTESRLKDVNYNSNDLHNTVFTTFDD